ncbi:SARP family transcriptional regulator [Virgisporangium aurantiacum]|uniref:SARP family transcriptional regulator n=1 Tax=Virgisporangium aurantiacum TaxID=175570 RepID=A0A8J3ZKU7_9ACTN|nr:SARP family transcriptional regulator [Virgisporangium aurantiacum]
MLGPVELSADGRLVDAGRPRQRVVLAALLADAGRLVSSEALIDRVWAEAPPQGARRALHAHLSRIRGLLEGSAPLVYRSGGYLLDVDPDRVDLHRFRRLVANGGGAGDLRDALRLWRGEPMAGLTGEWVVRTRQAWVRERLDATIAWADNELSIGNAEVTVGPLTDLAAEHPLLEPLVAVLLRALHAAGRSATALSQYAALRERLADELGAEPSASVEAVHRTILRGDAAVTGSGRPPKAMRTLPAAAAGFVGRHDELRRLLAAAGGARTVVIHAVDGMAGVGKTTFAIHAAHHLAAHFPDGQQFVDLRAHSPARATVGPAEALAVLLEADGVAAAQVPLGLDGRAGLWRERTAGRRILLVLDDAADAAHVSPLLPSAPGSLVLVTSRRKLATLPGATLTTLNTLPAADAARLFTHRAGPRAEHDAAAVRRIVDLCGNLPLAVALTAARLHTHPTWTVADLAADLDRAHDRLGALVSGQLAVAAAFDLSYHGLPADRRRLFRRLALHPGPDLDAHAAAALDDTTAAQARRGLEELLESNLLTEPRRGRYCFHELVAEHARVHAATDPDRDAAVDRLLSYYQHAATTAADGSDAVADVQDAADWFTVEHANLAAAVLHAADRDHPAAIAIPAALKGYLRNRGPWDVAIRLHHTAVISARRVGDRSAEAHALTNLADVQRQVSDPAATATAERAHTIHEQLGDRRGQAAALNVLARARKAAGDVPAAIATAERAYALHQDLGDRHGQAADLYLIATSQIATSAFPAAVANIGLADTLYRQLGDRRGQAVALGTLAWAQYMTVDFSASAANAEHARRLHRQIGNRPGEAHALTILARVRRATGDCARAAEAAELALALYEELRDPHGQATALEVLARAHHAAGDYPAALAVAERAYALCRRSAVRHGEAEAAAILGAVQHARGDHRAAAAALDSALTIFRHVGNLDGEAEVLNHLGRLHLDTAASAAAHRTFTAALGIARRIGSTSLEANAVEGIGTYLIHTGRFDAGTRHLRDALAIYRRIHSPNATRVEEILSSCGPRQGNPVVGADSSGCGERHASS